jgi:hypothetical protein
LNSPSKTLVITHNAGFFSCCSIRLFEIIQYFNKHNELPEVVDSSQQFEFHKIRSTDGDISQIFFTTTSDDISFEKEIRVSDGNYEVQFSDYRQLNYDQVNPFIKKYFSPSQYVLDRVDKFINSYSIDLDSTCGVFYRGLDKARETHIMGYDVYISKCRQIKIDNPNIKFLVQTDESNFLTEFLQVFPDSIVIRELPTLPKSDTLVTYHVDRPNRIEFGVNFLAATLILSKCRYLVTHTGNCSNWACFFRGNSENVFQYITPYVHSSNVDSNYFYRWSE